MPCKPPASRSTIASSSSGLNGLLRNESAPASSAASDVPPSEPLKTTIGTSFVARSRFNWRLKARPSIPGRLTSRTIASGRRRRIAASADGTSSASSTSTSTASSVARSRALSPGSSSTSKRRKVTSNLVSTALFFSAEKALAFSSIDVEAFFGLAAQFSLLHVLFEQRGRRVLVVPEPLLQDFHDCNTCIQADQVGQLEWPHGVREPKLRNRVDCLNLRDAVL